MLQNINKSLLHHIIWYLNQVLLLTSSLRDKTQGQILQGCQLSTHFSLPNPSWGVKLLSAHHDLLISRYSNLLK